MASSGSGPAVAATSGAQGGVGGEHAGVGVAVPPGRRDELGQPVEELERVKHDVVPAVDVSGRELVDQGVLVEPSEPTGGPGRSGAVAHEPLESEAVLSGGGDRAVDEEPAGAQPFGERRSDLLTLRAITRR